jgi:hypothetical protein
MDPGPMPETLTTQPSHYRRGTSPLAMVQSPSPSMDFDSRSSTEFEVVTPDEEESVTDSIEPTSLCTWRAAHTLKNQNGTKIETPTAPALVFW